MNRIPSMRSTILTCLSIWIKAKSTNSLSRSYGYFGRGGVHRIVVPDFERLCARYLNHIPKCNSDDKECAAHDDYVANIIEQCVRKESFGTSKQPPIRRRIEKVLYGDARKRGETHQWMYDRVNLSHTLIRNGYSSVKLRSFEASDIPNWSNFFLDVDENGRQYKPGSLYIEATK